MDTRSVETLEWLDSVTLPDGEAYAERELLRLIVDGRPTSGPNLLATAYQRDLAQRETVFDGTRTGARQFAHKVLFASDFGGLPLEVPADAMAPFDAELTLNADDSDTVGELLITALILGYSSAATQAARAAFDLAWAGLDREDVAANYHCILVGALLYALES